MITDLVEIQVQAFSVSCAI